MKMLRVFLFALALMKRKLLVQPPPPTHKEALLLLLLYFYPPPRFLPIFPYLFYHAWDLNL